MTLKKLLDKVLRRWKLLLLVAVLIIGGGFWFYTTSKANQPTLTFIKPQHENLVKTLDVSGIVDAKEKAQLRFIAGGKVVYLGAKEGDTVKKGQTIATIDRAALQKQLEQDLINYDKERTDWEQTLDDTKDRVLPTEEQRQKSKSELDLKSQALSVEIRDISIRNTVLSAPFAGILTSSPTNVTGVTLLGSDAFEIVNPATLVFIGRVDEADIAQVKDGQLTRITLDAFPDQEYETYVDHIAFTSSQTTSGTAFDVEFPLAHLLENAQFRLGMNGDAKIVLDERTNVMSIPITATRQREDKIFVDVRTGETTTEEREVKVGLETEEKYEVLEGLSVNEEILLPE